jgi:ATP-dependent DNA helicase PIF1
VHGFLGQAFRQRNIQLTIENIMGDETLSRRWSDTDVLIIDHMQLVDWTMFDDMDAVAQSVRRSTKAFGGIQIIVATDFYGLSHITQHGGSKNKGNFVFERPAWKACEFAHVRLDTVYRFTDQVCKGDSVPFPKPLCMKRVRV